jgi:hypothetical protein
VSNGQVIRQDDLHTSGWLSYPISIAAALRHHYASQAQCLRNAIDKQGICAHFVKLILDAGFSAQP